MASSKPGWPFVNLGMRWSSKATWTLSRWRNWVLRTRSPRSAQLARRSTFKSCFVRQIPSYSASMAIRPAAAPRAVRWTRACRTPPTTARSASCSCQRNTIRTATCVNSVPVVLGEQVDRASPLSQFLLNEVLNDKELDQPEGRAKALFDAKPLLQALPANALRVQILHMLADRLNTPFGEIAALCDID